MGIFAFEPIPGTFGYLKRNIALNQVTSIYANNFGFSDNSGELVFYFHPEGSGSASSVDIMGTGAAQKIHCRVQKLDEFVAKAGVSCIDFMKCDVEGAEFFVLKGGIDSIKRFKPIILTEMLRKWAAKFNYHPNEIIELMAEIGYRCFVSRNGKLEEFARIDEQTVETNFFFLHPQVHALKIKEFVSAAM
jgi:FkbM family methyltransferase